MPSITNKHRALQLSTPLNIRKTLRYAEASIFTGLPLTKLEQLVANGYVKSAKIGRTRLLDRASLEAVIDDASLEPINPSKPFNNQTIKS